METQAKGDDAEPNFPLFIASVRLISTDLLKWNLTFHFIIRKIALMCKECGADIHHIGDTGASLGMADPENILAYSMVIRGKQHTWLRMAASINC